MSRVRDNSHFLHYVLIPLTSEVYLLVNLFENLFVMPLGIFLVFKLESVHIAQSIVSSVEVLPQAIYHIYHLDIFHA